mgnify:CR=1 FL=1
MSQCVEKLPHDCGSGDGLQVFHNGKNYDGYCFACDTYVEYPYSYEKIPDIKSFARVQLDEDDLRETVAGIQLMPFADLPERKLTKASFNYFGVRTALSEVDGTTPIVHYYPYTKKGELSAYKCRLLSSKNMWSIGGFKDVDFFGWEQAKQAGGKKLFITEGELDAVALWQVLTDRQKGTKWEGYTPSVVSLPSGSGCASNIVAKNLNEIQSRFKEVILCFDMDKPGKEAAKDVVQILPRARVALLPSKDANQCLMDGRSRALGDAVLFKAATLKNTRIVLGSELHDSARVAAKMGMSWPWEQMTEMTRGIRFGETYYIGAGVKMGKSEVVNAIAAHLITEHDLKVFLAKPEEANNKSYKMLVGKVVGRIFHDPKISFDYDAYDRGSKLIRDQVHLLNVWQHLGWETLRQDIILSVSLGCKAIFIDPITNLINGVPPSEANTVLQSISQDLAAMALDLDICIFIFCHLRNPETGPPHERGGKVQSYQFSGSRAMMRSCNYMIGLEGNKDPDFEDEKRNIRKIVILEDREFGHSGYLYVYWDRHTGLFNEMKES